jgi:hypothetical protein
VRAYKFRSAAQIEYALDIIVNSRLRCSPWNKLNDPMEGMYAFNVPPGREHWAQRMVKGIADQKGQYKVCSLSSDFQSHLLWAHYAGGFDGVAIEVDLPDDDPRIRDVEYRGVFAFCDMEKVVNEQHAAELILFSKYQEWAYEREIRILSNSDWYQLQRPPVRVIAGHRMNDALFRVLGTVCKFAEVEFARVGIGDEGIDADPVYPDDLRFPRRPRPDH